MALTASLGAHAADAAEPDSVDCPPADEAIPSQALLDALICLSRRTGVPFFVEPATIAEQRSSVVAPGDSLADMLAAIVAGTDVEARLEGDAILVRRRSGFHAAPDRRRPPRDVVRVRGFRGGFAEALALKRNAPQFLDAITGEEVGQFPDQNLAEAAQRLPGVTISRIDGAGETVSVRGLDPTFTRVEIDGRTTAVTMRSAAPSRASVLSIFASDLYDVVEVIKSPNAADVEGGVGGVLRLTTPDPLAYGEARWGAQASLTRADLRDEAEPGAAFFYSDVFANGRAGLLLSGDYQRTDRRLDRAQSNQDWLRLEEDGLADPSDPALRALIGGRYPGRSRQEQRIGDGARVNLSAKLRAELSSDLSLTLNGLYAEIDHEDLFSRIQTQWSRGLVAGGALDPATGSLAHASVLGPRTEYRQHRREETIEAVGGSLSIDWSTGPWRLHGEAGQTSSTEDRSEHRVEALVESDGLAGYDTSGDPRLPRLMVPSATIEPDELPVDRLLLEKRIIKLEATELTLDVERYIARRGVRTIEIGARFASSRFERLQGEVEGVFDALTYADGALGYVVDGGFGGGDILTTWPSIDPRPLYEEHPAERPFAYDDEDVWTITEDTSAVYGLANFEATRPAGLIVQGDLGARIVSTRYAGQGRIDVDLFADGPEFLIDDAPTVTIEDTRILPAFNVLVRNEARPNVQLRAAIARAIARPTINEINPAENVNVGEATIQRGNPALDPFLAWQYDLGVERYFGDGGEGLVAATLFYKDVENFIAPVRLDEVRAFPVAGAPPQTYEVRTFDNGGAASIFGVELDVQTPFTFAPGPLSDFGVFANYTYTDSTFTEPDGRRHTFPGASRHSANLVGYYERGGFSGRLAYSYRGDYLVARSSDEDGANTVFGEAQGRLDLGLRHRFKNGVRLSLDALNLTEEQGYFYYDDPGRLENFEVEGRIYSLSVGFVH